MHKVDLEAGKRNAGLMAIDNNTNKPKAELNCREDKPFVSHTGSPEP
jgi:hypothetical protein